MDEEEQEDEGPPSCFDPQRGVFRILATQCSTCIFRPGNLMHLDEGRLADMLASVRANDSHVVCHQSLGRPVGDVCKGSNDAHVGQAARMAERLGIVALVEPEAKG